jgi:hypothetical protein
MMACHMKAGVVTFTMKAVTLGRIELPTADADAARKNAVRIGTHRRRWKTSDL